MKTKIVCIVLMTLLILTALPAMGITISNRGNFQKDENEDSSNKISYIPDTWLITTEWGQRQLYNTKCPIDPDTSDNYRLGCWSVAIGQIIRFHELQSYGEVVYLWGDLNTLVNDLSSHEYDWDNMPDVLHAGSTEEEKDNVSWLLYDTATVIQKNWGTDYYCLTPTKMVEEIKEHYQYIAEQTEVEDNPDINEIIEEIDGYRPCMLYLEKLAGGGHAVVIDGYRFRRDFEVHLNMGWYGTENNWYVYNDSILDYDDNSVRKVIFIRIAPNKPQKPVGPGNGSPGLKYDFQTQTTVKNNLPIYYRWDWGDGTFSNWMGRYESGEICTASHTWKEKGKYQIRVKARDVNGWESPWSDPFSINIPRNRITTKPFLLSIFNSYISMFPMLEILLQRFV